MTKTIPKKKKCKVRCLSEEALQIAEKKKKKPKAKEERKDIPICYSKEQREIKKPS